MKNPYALPDTIKPIRYDLELTPDFKDLTFTGSENIEINAKKTKKIILNAQDLTIKKAEIKNNGLKNISYNKKYQTVTFTFNNSIRGEVNLHLEFGGKIREDLRGWYKSVYKVKGKERTMLTTQFEATDARKCFPCFDQPDLKAVFSLKLNVPKDLDAISNMPIKKQLTKNSLKEIIFQDTPLMSTYLLAFVISKLEYVEGKTKNNVKVRVYTTPGKKHKANFALNVTTKSLEFYEDYFKIPYPLPKLDLIAIPDFESGAMENWGLITYRENQLLFDEKESSVGIKQAVAITVTHELAHQWFGNLVTMKWWNDLWLNEGFASWIEYKATDHIFPDFDIWTQYLTDEKIPALYLDSLNSSHPIEVNVINPAEINEVFDAISYNKGSCVIRMLEEYLGENVFRRGLQHYLNKFKYKNAETEDLWMSLQKISGKPVKKLMHTWTRQTGYPIVSVSCNKRISLEQERFFYLKKKDKTLWNIPVLINAKHYELNRKKTKIKDSENFLVNHNQVGFYRIKYDKELFEKIISSELNVLDKIGTSNDVYALARGSHIKIKDYIKLIKNYKNENSYAIWDDISVNLGKIQLLFADKYLDEINNFIKNLFSEIYKKVGWKEKPNESHTDILLRANVLATLGLSDHEEILETANKMFNEHLKGKKINPNLRSLVYNLVAYSGNKKTFKTLRDMYINEVSQEEKTRLLASLGAFKQKEILKEALKFSLSKNVRNQDAMYILSVVGSNEYADDLSWQFLKENWNEYHKRYKEGHIMPNLIKASVSRFSSLEKIDEIKKFFKKNPVQNAKRSIEQSLEAIKINYNFVKNNEDNLGI